MKNVFALSALLLTSLVQAGESSLATCLECTKETAIECGAGLGGCGTLIGLCGVGAKFYQLNRSEGPQRSGNAFDHSAERSFFNGAEDTLAEYGLPLGAACCALPVAAYTSALCLLTCCYSKEKGN